MTDTVRTRFAPSPTGFMHIGNLRSGLYAYLFAKRHGGAFVLRIEDTDRTRYVEGAVDAIYRTLKLAGINHDEGPDKDGGYGPYIQSERKNLYKQYAEMLVERGSAFYCFCDEQRLEGLKNEDGIKKYDGCCRDLTKEDVAARIARGDAYVIRHKVPHNDGVGRYHDAVYGDVEVAYKEMDDIVLLKSDGMPTYNFANVVDDHLMNINWVIRGCEYLSTTPQYNLIYQGFGWNPPSYAHLPHIMRDQHNKLSKRHGDANFEDFYQKGYLPEAIVNYIALLGWSSESNREKLSLAEMEEEFDFARVNKSPAIFDPAKMRWLNGEYIKELPDDIFIEKARPFIAQSAAEGMDEGLLTKLLKSRIEIFADIPEKVAFLGEWEGFDLTLFDNAKQKCDKTVAGTVLPPVIEALRTTEFQNDALFAALSAVAETLGVKKNAVMWAVRIALTGAATTPGGATEMAVLLGREKSIDRLVKVAERLNG